jgi:ABC-type transport system involved in multi-copper enzyme maturation permease subunit
MSGLLKADLLRFRKHGGIKVIVVAVPILTAFLFLLGALAAPPDLPPFDAAAYRQELIDQGVGFGLPQEQADQILDGIVAAEAENQAQQHAQNTMQRSLYAFPQSLLTVLGNSYMVLFATILLTATTLGDEFGWATIRIALLASSDRRRFLAVRLAVISVLVAVIVAVLLALGALLPLVAGALGAHLPAPAGLHAGALAVLVAGLLVCALAVTGFAAFATLLVRSSALTLVAVLVYGIVEAAILSALLRIPVLQPGHDLDWIPNVFPIRGFVTFFDSTMNAAGRLMSFPGEVVDRSLQEAWVPLIALAIWAALFLTLAFRRFGRMDIVE